jgi:hypothetical protein
MEVVTGTIAQLWRWPVAGMRPERLRAARLGPRGMAGDRVHTILAGEQVLDEDALVAWKAEYPFNPDAGIDAETPPHPIVVSPDGQRRWRWGDPRLKHALAAALGHPVELRRELDRAQPVLVSAQRDVPAHLRLALDAPAERLAGHELVLAGGVRLLVSGPAGRRGGIEAQVLDGGRLAVGEPFELV